jgi:hypothetical protein
MTEKNPGEDWDQNFKMPTLKGLESERTSFKERHSEKWEESRQGQCPGSHSSKND